jgi:hypothetical protein
MKINTDTASFLETLLWANEFPAAWTIHEFHPEFVAAADSFLSGFREYLSNLRDTAADPELLDEDATGRSYGGNVYLSLSGHGAGFWDDRDTERGEALQTALVTHSGDKYRFEQIDLAKFHGKIHLAFRLAIHRREYLNKMFAVPAAA